MNRRALIALSAALAIAVPAKAEEEAPRDISLINLIATPERFDGKRVRLVGFLRIEFEGNALYLHEEDLRQGITDNAVWIDLPKGTDRKHYAPLSDHYVLVEGRFEANLRGHLNLFSGTITDVTRLEIWASGAG